MGAARVPVELDRRGIGGDEVEGRRRAGEQRRREVVGADHLAEQFGAQFAAVHFNR